MSSRIDACKLPNAAVEKSEPSYSQKNGTAKQKFLFALAETGSVRLASQASGKSRSAWIKQRAKDEAFAKDWDQSIETYVEILEAEADRRAISGDEEPIFYGGKLVGVRTKPSDSLLMFRLKALRPQRYRDANSDNALSIKVEVRSFADMPDASSWREKEGNVDG